MEMPIFEFIFITQGFQIFKKFFKNALANAVYDKLHNID